MKKKVIVFLACLMLMSCKSLDNKKEVEKDTQLEKTVVVSEAVTKEIAEEKTEETTEGKGEVVTVSKLKGRDEIEEQYKWNVDDIYSNWEEWQVGFDRLSTLMDEMASLKGTIKDAESLYRVLSISEELNALSYRVYRYPQLQKDVDSKNNLLNQKFQEVGILFSKFGTATSWLTPEILTIPEDQMVKWIDDNPEKLEIHRFPLMDTYRLQKHVLDEAQEKLLSYYSQFKKGPRDIFTALSVTDIEFPTVSLSEGDFQLSPSQYYKIMSENRNREDREKSYKAYYKVYEKNKNTYAAIYNAIVQKNFADTKARNYASILEGALEGNNIPVDVYKSLVNGVRANTKPLQRYRNLRKRALNLDVYNTWDGSIKLIDFTKEYEYDIAKDLVLNSVAPLGENYQDRADTALNNRWIDVYENEGKRSGAYSAGTYGVHPYMLMNYNGTLGDVFTLAHELGHTLHTMLSDETQPFTLHDYTIFVAEVASTYNEKLLLNHMLEKSDDPLEKAALLEQSIRNLVGTFYVQVMFADYELQVHELVEKGEPITADTLDNIVKELLTTYYGEDVILDDYAYLWWTRIPHFFNSPFYVYQYATCYASSAKFYDLINNPERTEEERQANLDKYINLLKSGGNDYPMNQLKKAGVDLSQEETMLEVANELDVLLDEFEKVLAELELLN